MKNNAQNSILMLIVLFILAIAIALITKYPKQSWFAVITQVAAGKETHQRPDGNKLTPSTRGKPEKNATSKDAHLLGHLVALVRQVCLDAIISGNSTSTTPSDKRLQNKNGLMRSENGEKQVRAPSENTCVNNIFSLVATVRKWPLEQLQQNLPPTISNLVAGMVLGSKNSSAPELQHKIKITGMQHVMVASGSNIGLVYYSSLSVLSRFLARRRAAFMALVSIFWYIWLIGAEPPVVRAAVMASLGVGASLWLGRQVRPLWLLGVTALCLLSLNLEWLTSLSFQLSFASTLSILMWMPVFQSSSAVLTKLDFLNSRSASSSEPTSLAQQLLSILLEALQMTLAAQVLTLPLVLHNFGEVSSLLVVANTLLVPLVPLITLSGFVFLLSSAVLQGLQLAELSQVLSWMVFLPSKFFVWGLTQVSQIPLPVFTVTHFSWWAVIGWWSAAAALYGAYHSITSKKTKITFNYYLE